MTFELRSKLSHKSIRSINRGFRLLDNLILDKAVNHIGVSDGVSVRTSSFSYRCDLVLLLLFAFKRIVRSLFSNMSVVVDSFPE
jgi:hypothetical protein